MKKVIFYFSVFVFSVQVSFAQGIEFEHNSWSKIVAKAKQENKLIFLDAYTSWCGPCKLMQAKVFPNETLGAYFNENFVSAKIDMEKGEGPSLAGKFNVRAYPTLFFIDPNTQKVVQRVLGYRTPEQLMETGKLATTKKSI